MKQKNKKHLRTFLKFLLKVIFYYPFKFLWYILTKIVTTIYVFIKNKYSTHKQTTLQTKANQSRTHTTYEPFHELKSLKGTLPEFEQKILHNKSTIGIILGARGTGKSALAMRLVENIIAKTNKHAYAMGFSSTSLPAWITLITTTDEITNNSLVVIDESGISFSSRSSMSSSSKLLSALLLIARHKDVSVIFITQNSANLEINAIRQADYLLLKPSSLLQKDFERKKIQDIYLEAQSDFDKLKSHIGLTYIYADSYRGFVTNTLPSFWSENLSKSFANKK